VSLHAEVLLVALLAQVHLGVTLAVPVLGRTRRCDERGINHGAGLEHQPPGRQRGDDGGHDLRAQLLFVQLVAKSQNVALVGQSAHARVQPGELAAQRHITQGLFHGRIVQAKVLLHEVNTQHVLHGKGRPSSLARRRMRPNQRHRLRPRNHQVHFVEKFTLARALGRQLKSGGG